MTTTIMDPPKDTDLRNPSSLFQLALECVRSNAKEIFLEKKVPKSNDWMWKKQSFKLKEDVFVPGQILEHVLTGYSQTSDEILWLRLTLARTDMSHTITKLSLRNCSDLDDNTLGRLMNTNITSLDIHGCPRLTLKSFNVLNTYGANLTDLIVGNSVKVLPVTIFRGHEQDDPAVGWRSLVNRLSNRISRLVSKDPPNSQTGDPLLRVTAQTKETLYELRTPKLTKLVVWGNHVQQMMSDPKVPAYEEHPRVNYWRTLLSPFIRFLKYLDISQCTGIKNFEFLLHAANSLEVLILHDVHIPESYEGWGAIHQLPFLKFLDVSESVELAALYRSPESLLPETLEAFQNLQGLDISGTNLAGSGLDNDSLGFRRFAFLGLVCTHFHADRRGFNAAKIAGTFGEDQIITSVSHYINRPEMLKKALRALLDAVTNHEEFHYIVHSHYLMAKILEIHSSDKAIVTLVFAYLRKPFTTGGICDFDVRSKLSSKLRLRLVHNIISIIETRMDEPEIFLAGIYVLKHYNIFVSFPYEPAMSPLNKYFNQNCLWKDSQKRLHLAELVVQRLQMGFPNPQETWWVQWMLYDCNVLLKVLLFAMEDFPNELTKLMSSGCIQALCKVLESFASEGMVQDSLFIIWGILNSLMNNATLGQEARLEFVAQRGLIAFMKCVEYNGPREPTFCPKLPALCCASTVSEMQPLRQYFCDHPEILNYLENLILRTNLDGNESIGLVLQANVRLLAMTCLFNLFTEPQTSGLYEANASEYIRVLEEVAESSSTNPDLVEALRYNDISHLIELIESKTEASQMFGMWVMHLLVKLYPETYVPMMMPYFKRSKVIAESPLNMNRPFTIRFLNPALSIISTFQNDDSKKNSIINPTT